MFILDDYAPDSVRVLKSILFQTVQLTYTYPAG